MSQIEEIEAIATVLDSFRTSNKFSAEYPEIIKAIAKFQQKLSAWNYYMPERSEV